jgi:hypothetical protein
MRFIRLATSILITGVLVALLACSSGSESDAVSRQDCERLRAHLVELRMQSVTADHDQHRIAIRSSLDDSFISSCVENNAASALQCAMAAKDSDALLACADLAASPAP